MCCFLSVLEGPVLVEICVIGLFTDIVSAHLFGLARHVLFQISFFFQKCFFRALRTGDSYCSDSRTGGREETELFLVQLCQWRETPHVGRLCCRLTAVPESLNT